MKKNLIYIISSCIDFNIITNYLVNSLRINGNYKDEIIIFYLNMDENLISIQNKCKLVKLDITSEFADLQIRALNLIEYNNYNQIMYIECNILCLKDINSIFCANDDVKVFKKQWNKYKEIENNINCFCLESDYFEEFKNIYKTEFLNICNQNIKKSVINYLVSNNLIRSSSFRNDSIGFENDINESSQLIQFIPIDINKISIEYKKLTNISNKPEIYLDVWGFNHNIMYLPLFGILSKYYNVNIFPDHHIKELNILNPEFNLKPLSTKHKNSFYIGRRIWNWSIVSTSLYQLKDLALVPPHEIKKIENGLTTTNPILRPIKYDVSINDISEIKEKLFTKRAWKLLLKELNKQNISWIYCDKNSKINAIENIAASKIYLGLESEYTHIAAALHKPTVLLWSIGYKLDTYCETGYPYLQTKFEFDENSKLLTHNKTLYDIYCEILNKLGRDIAGGETLKINTPSDDPINFIDINIINAKYGTSDKNIDVTDIVKKLLVDGDFFVCDISMECDPHIHNFKNLFINGVYKNQILDLVVDQNTYFSSFKEI